MNPFENIRRFAINSPPMVVFIASLCCITIGFATLAYTLNMKQDQVLNAELCMQLLDSNIFQNNGPLKYNVTVPASISIRKDKENHIEQMSDVLPCFGHVQPHDFGLHEMSNDVNFTIRADIITKDGHCDRNKCTWDTCLVFSSDQPSKWPQLFGTCNGSDSQSAIDSSTVARLNADGCKNPGVSIQLRFSNSYIMLMLHDTMMARMHLLYSSYFIFFAVLVVLSYAMCRRHRYGVLKLTERVEECAK